VGVRVVSIGRHKTAYPARVVVQLNDEDDRLLTIVSRDEPTFSRVFIG
jgi:hypothetical protein